MNRTWCWEDCPILCAPLACREERDIVLCQDTEEQEDGSDGQ
jgi:hypothetical protein